MHCFSCLADATPHGKQIISIATAHNDFQLSSCGCVPRVDRFLRLLRILLRLRRRKAGRRATALSSASSSSSVFASLFWFCFVSSAFPQCLSVSPSASYSSSSSLCRLRRLCLCLCVLSCFLQLRLRSMSRLRLKDNTVHDCLMTNVGLPD